MDCTCDHVEIDEHHLMMRIHSDDCPEHGALDAEADEPELVKLRDR